MRRHSCYPQDHSPWDDVARSAAKRDGSAARLIGGIMLVPFLQNFNVEEYFRAHAADWGPRLGRVISYSSDSVALLVRGPSLGKEFHVGRGDEIFYQVRGELQFHYVTEEGQRKL